MFELQFITGTTDNKLFIGYRLESIEHAKDIAEYTLKALHGSKYTQCHIFKDGEYVETLEATFKVETQK